MSQNLHEHPFFKSRDMKGALLNDILLHMDLLEMESREEVITIGEQGDLFYFILDGSVEVRIPDHTQ